MATNSSLSSVSTLSHFPFSGPNTVSFLKLDETNYLQWLCQMKSFIIGQGLYKFVNGTYTAPPLPPQFLSHLISLLSSVSSAMSKELLIMVLCFDLNLAMLVLVLIWMPIGQAARIHIIPPVAILFI